MFTVCVKRPTRPHMNGDSIDQWLLIRKRVAGVYQAVTRAEGGLHRKDKHRQQTSLSSWWWVNIVDDDKTQWAAKNKK